MLCEILKAVVQNNENNQAPPVFFPWFRLVLYNISWVIKCANQGFNS